VAVGRITPICKLTAALFLCAAPSYASVDDGVIAYANARAAEFDARHGEALAEYLKLFEESSDSATLAKRVYQNAVRQGDFAAALQAIRVRELKNDVPPEGPLLLFTDAFQKRRWSLALLAADELEARSNFGFMAPILRAWVSVAKTGTHDLTLKEGNTDSFFNFYAVDQIVYLDLATGQNAKAKLGLRNMVSVGGDAMRDLFISAAPVLAHKGDAAFANAMLGAVMGSDFAGQFNDAGTPKSTISPNIGLAALYVRIATSLIEQDVPEPGLALARLALWTAPEYPPAVITTAVTRLHFWIKFRQLRLIGHAPFSQRRRCYAIWVTMTAQLNLRASVMIKMPIRQRARRSLAKCCSKMGVCQRLSPNIASQWTWMTSNVRHRKAAPHFILCSPARWMKMVNGMKPNGSFEMRSF
jgi:hypothetical protein